MDESMGRPIAGVLRNIRAPAAPYIFDARDENLTGISDDELMRKARALGIDVIVWADSRVLNASIRRNAWRETSLTMFVLQPKWSDLPLFEQVRRLIWWWPQIVDRAEGGPIGAAWLVPFEISGREMTRLFPEME